MANARYKATPPTIADGDLGEHLLDANGRMVVTTDSGSANGVASSVGSGRKVVTTAGVPVALATTTACKSVVITAETDNTGVISVGASGVIASLSTRTGTPLSAGDSMSLDVSNLSVIFLDSTVNGDGVTYTYTA